MAELICVAFDGPRMADEALSELQIMRHGCRVELADACVVRCDGAGGVHRFPCPATGLASVVSDRPLAVHGEMYTT